MRLQFRTGYESIVCPLLICDRFPFPLLRCVFVVRRFHLQVDCRRVFPSFSVLTVASKMHDLRDEYSSKYFGQANQSVKGKNEHDKIMVN